MGTDPLIVDALVKHYRTRTGKREVRAVDGVSFVVRAGECFGLLGPNGAGKSTTINCLTGFYPPTGGRVLVSGYDVHRSPKAARRWLGVCSQEDTLDTDFTVVDQLVRHATFFNLSVGESRRRADAILERFSLTDKAKEPVEALSGGMRRRLQVARALISEPKVLVLDEPSTGLDPEARRDLWEILRESRTRGMAVCLSTHYMEEAERLCDRIAILHRGRILDMATAPELVTRHAPKEDVEEEVRPGVLWRRPPNLEDVFLRLAGRGLAEVGA